MQIIGALTSFLLINSAVVEGFSPSLSQTKLSARNEIGTYEFRTSLKAASLASEEEKCTIQILMSDTGGGHRASANALRDALDTLHPGKIECDIVDIYTDYGPFWPVNSYVPIYKIMAEYSFLWKWFYEFGETPYGLWLNDFLLETFCFDAFQSCIERSSGSTNKRADMVVSVHPLCQSLPLKILSSLDSGNKSRNEGRTTPFVTVVTDLGGAHTTWFNPGVDKCFVPSDVLYQKALSRDLISDQLVQYGLPIRRGFWADTNANTNTDGTDNARPKGLFNFFAPKKGAKFDSKSGCENIRSKLGLVEDIPTVMVVGGGDGMGGIIDQALALGRTLNEKASDTSKGYQMVVICGNNEKAKKTLEEESWGLGVTVQIEGFVNNMDEYMRASDAIVTKAGPGTIAEASICGLPCMLSSYLPGQEEGNVPFVEESGFGKYCGDPKGIADTVSTWLASPDMLKEMKQNALKAARPSATVDIARDLADILFEHKNMESSKA